MKYAIKFSCSSSDAKSLATFYENLLGWEMKVYNHGENERIG